MFGVKDDTWRRASRKGLRTVRSPIHRSATRLFVLGGLILAAVLCVAPDLIKAQTDQTPVEIRIEGNSTIPDYAIMRHLKSAANRPTNQHQVREDVRQLYATRWFLNVEPRFRETDEGTILVFKVVERPIVQSVQFVGNKKIKDKVLRALTGLEVGSPFDVSSNRESVRRIIDRYKEKGFAFVKVELAKGGDPTDRDIVFRIEEGPVVRVYQRVTHGAKFVSNARVKTQLVTKQTFNFGLFQLSGIYSPDSKNADIQALKQYYQRHGFLDVEVRAEEKFSNDRSRVRMDYHITEGPRFRIRNLKIDGNKEISTEQIVGDLKINQGGFFEANKIAADVAEMKKKYGKLGRLMAQVEAVPRYLEEPGLVDLVYRIDEDVVRYIRKVNVVIEGDFPHTKRSVILDRSLISPGDPADPEMIKKTKGRLAGSGLFEAGPGGVRIAVNPVELARGMAGMPGDGVIRGQAPERSWVPEPITFNLVPGHVGPADTNQTTTRRNASQSTRALHDHQSYRFGTTRPHNARTQESTDFPSALRSNGGASSTGFSLPQPTAPGSTTTETTEPLTSIYEPVPEQVALNADEEPIFRAQNIDGPFRPPNNPIYDNSPLGDPFGRSIRQPPAGWVDLDIYATEGRTGRMMFGVGVNSDAGVVGNVVVDESNFDIWRWPRNWSDIVDGRAWRGGGQRFRLEAVPGDQVSRYMLQWTDPFFMHTDYSLSLSGFYFNRFYDDWRENRLGGRVSLGKQLDPFWSVSTAFRYEEVELEDPATPTPFALTSALGDNQLITATISVTHDTRDASILPGAGHYAQASYEQAFGDFQYPRFEGEFRQYFTTFQRADGSGKQVLSMSGNVGWSGDDTPIFERFYAGGFQTFRGFRFRGVTPREFGVGTGGNFSFLGSVEYRLPVTANDMIQVVGFSDFGTIEEDTSFDNFRVSVGAGLRLTIPAMGPVPLAFDFAFPIVKQDIDERQVFSFYVGINR